MHQALLQFIQSRERDFDYRVRSMIRSYCGYWPSLPEILKRGLIVVVPNRNREFRWDGWTLVVEEPVFGDMSFGNEIL